MDIILHVPPWVLSIPFLFWATILFLSVIFDKDGYEQEGKSRGKVTAMALSFLIIGVLIIL